MQNQGLTYGTTPDNHSPLMYSWVNQQELPNSSKQKQQRNEEDHPSNRVCCFPSQPFSFTENDGVFLDCSFNEHEVYNFEPIGKMAMCAKLNSQCRTFWTASERRHKNHSFFFCCASALETKTLNPITMNHTPTTHLISHTSNSSSSQS